MSGIVGDNVARASGVVASAGGGGKLLATEFKGWDTISSLNPGGYTSFADIGSASHTITPTAAGSSILINCNITYSGTLSGTFRVQADIGGAGYNTIFQGASSGSRTRGLIGCMSHNSEDMKGLNGPWLWTPSYTLTDVLTVKFQVSGTGTRYNNRVISPTDANYCCTGYSTIVLQEIGA